MKLLEEKILAEGTVLPGHILKVGSFLNQQIDVETLRAIGDEIARLYKWCGVTKILTIESSGIAMAAAASLAMNVPMVFAKKHKSFNISGSVLCTNVHSYTHGEDYNVVVSSDYLRSDDVILLVDDFLAVGNALNGLIDLVRQSGAALAGAAVAIEKGFQGGGDTLRAQGVRVEALALIDSMTDDTIVFRP